MTIQSLGILVTALACSKLTLVYITLNFNPTQPTAVMLQYVIASDFAVWTAQDRQAELMLRNQSALKDQARKMRAEHAERYQPINQTMRSH